MKDFDAMLPKDREFTVGGETFHWRDVRPEALMTFGDETKLDGLPLMDAQILLFLEPAQHDRWNELRSRDDRPVTIGQMTAIITWLMEEQTGRPTEAPSPSASGRLRTAATSKAA